MSYVEDKKVESEHIEYPPRPLEGENKPSGTAEDFVTDNAQYHSPLNELSFWKTIRVFRYATLCCVLGSFGAVSDNFQLSVPGQILAQPGFVQVMGVPSTSATAAGGYAIPTYRVSAWGGINTGAQIVTNLVCSWFPPHDYYGRKPVLYAVQITMICACLIEMFATSWGVWAVAKMFNGISVGLNQQVASVYLSEVAPVNIRGAALNLYSFWWGIGGFACAIGMEVVSNLAPSQWRHIIYCQWVFSGIAMLAVTALPESPRYYTLKGNVQMAKKQLRRLYGSVEGYDVDFEYRIIEKEVEDGRLLGAAQHQTTWLTLFQGTNLRRTLISTSIFSWQLWLGVPVIFGYTSYFFELAGLQKPFLATVAINTVYIVALLVAIPLVEKLGRRPLLLVNGIIMILALVLVAILDKFIDKGKAYGTALIAFSCVWMAAYSTSAGPIGYVYLAEISTVSLRAKTVSMAITMTQVQNLFGTYAVPYMLNAPNFSITGTAGFFAGCAAVGWVIVYFCVPETRGRSYVELDELFERHVKARNFATTETSIDVVKRHGDA